MKFIREMIARKSKPTEVDELRLDPTASKRFEEAQRQDDANKGDMMDFASDELVLKNLAGIGQDRDAPKLVPVEPAKTAATPDPATPKDIWDIDLDDDVEDAFGAPQVAPAVAPVAVPEPTARPRTGRVKTRLLGFEHSDGTNDVFDDSNKSIKTASTMYPVGWIVVVEGPGRGNSFTLLSGMSQIGRGDDQPVQLNFGDNTISRTNHAAIAYDAEAHEFFLGHGGKSNLVRLNGKPVLSTEPLKTDDLVRIGETTLRFICLCDKDFNWAEDQAGGEADDMAIA